MINIAQLIKTFTNSAALQWLREEYEADNWMHRVLDEAENTPTRSNNLLNGKYTWIDAWNKTAEAWPLDDGIILIDLINVLLEKSTGGLVSKIRAVDTTQQSFRRVENVCMFLDACKKYFNMKEDELFEVLKL